MTRSLLPATLASLLLVGCGGTADSTPTDSLSPLPGGQAGASGSGGASGQGGAGHAGQAPAGQAGGGLAGAGSSGAGQGGASSLAGTGGLAGTAGTPPAGGAAGNGGAAGSLAAGAAGSGVAGGGGSAAECVVDADCPPPDPGNPCQTGAACVQGVCSPALLADGSVVANADPSDCVATVCQGGQPVVVPADETPLGDENLCTTEVCSTGSVAHLPVGQGVSCGTDRFCDGAGQCVPTPVIQLAAGLHHTCALLGTGKVRCWGQGIEGQLGYGAPYPPPDQKPFLSGDVELGGTAVQLSAGHYHTCVLLSTGGIRCWGENGSGQLGYGHTNRIGDDEVPATAPEVDVGGAAVQVAAGWAHTCALLVSGEVRCWGLFGDAALGQGSKVIIGEDEHPSSFPPVSVGGLVTQVVTRTAHTCALLDTKQVRCWGYNGHGQVGYPGYFSIGNTELPSDMPPIDIGAPVLRLAAGDTHTCALLDEGRVRCWGQWGTGYPVSKGGGPNMTAAEMGDVLVGEPVSQIATGERHTCALLASGALRCWGHNAAGQLGHGTTDYDGLAETPHTFGKVPVTGPLVQVVAGGYHTCALRASGTVSCWGSGGSGQLGYGDLNNIGDDELPTTVGDVPIVAP